MGKNLARRKIILEKYVLKRKNPHVVILSVILNSELEISLGIAHEPSAISCESGISRGGRGADPLEGEGAQTSNTGTFRRKCLWKLKNWIPLDGGGGDASPWIRQWLSGYLIHLN